MKFPTTEKVLGPVWEIWVEWKLMTGLFFTSKNLALLSVPSFSPLPVSTEDRRRRSG